MFGNDVLFLQRFLKSAGFYTGDLDGKFGPLTDKALNAFEDESDNIANRSSRFDKRSEQNIMTLLPHAQIKAREFMAAVQAADLDGHIVKIISGTRTYAEQAEIFAQGRTKSGRIVTKAGPGHSNHNFGIAWDIGIFKNGDYLDESSIYEDVGKIGKQIGLEWGGDWSSIVDLPHYQMPSKLSLAEVRQSFENGKVFV
ncbi:MAG: M15 family metallopeptidase [Proteobacteria bacterium]|nr:M15 family metallopeptidase [Pseudomonadota bacterium]